MRCKTGYMEYKGYCIPDSLQFAEAIDEQIDEAPKKRKGRALRNTAIALGGTAGLAASAYGARVLGSKAVRKSLGRASAAGNRLRKLQGKAAKELASAGEQVTPETFRKLNRAKQRVKSGTNIRGSIRNVIRKDTDRVGDFIRGRKGGKTMSGVRDPWSTKPAKTQKGKPTAEQLAAEKAARDTANKKYGDPWK